MFDDPNGAAGLFVKYNYAEAKDLAKSFLTLTSAVLAFSIAFSDKVVNFATARHSAKVAMAVAWSLIVLSVILSGSAICFIAWAAGAAVYGTSDIGLPAQISYLLLLLSGAAFVGGLIAMVMSAMISLFRGPAPTSTQA
jgi:hypothetical protein